MVVFPNCKINLGLHVTSKRSDGYHNIETLFFPIPLHDSLEIIPSPGAFEFKLYGIPLDDTSKNLCVQAYDLVKKDFPSLPEVKMFLLKAIPTGAGLGGGSSDATFTLQLLNKTFDLSLSKEQLLIYATSLGSDCPFFLTNKPCIATGRGETLEEIDISLKGYSIVLVHPGIHVSTAGAFSKLNPVQAVNSIKELVMLPIDQWKNKLVNDFEPTVFDLHPEIANVKSALYANGAVYASMSGSGSSVYGIFKKGTEPEQAKVTGGAPYLYKIFYF